MWLADAISAVQSRRCFPSEAPFFIDFLSLHQKAPAGGRTAEEAAAFTAALSSMQMWYAHASTRIFLIRDLPPHNPRWKGLTEYSGRGWTTCEALWASFGKSSLPNSAYEMHRSRVLDVGKLVRPGQLVSGAAFRTPPMGPHEAARLLASRRFTSKKADLATVISLSAKTIYSFFRHVEELNYSGNPFGDAGALQLVDVLQYCARLASLNLQKCAIGDIGMVAIGKWLGATSAPVKQTYLSGNPIGLRAAAALAAALKQNLALQELKLYLNFSTTNSSLSTQERKRAIDTLRAAEADREGAIKVTLTM